MTNLVAASSTRSINAFTRARNRILTPLLALAGAIFLTALFLPPPAMAQTPTVCSPKGGETVATNQASYVPSATVQFTGTGYGPQCSVALDVYVPDGGVDRANVTTDASGNFSTTYSLGSITGRYIFNVMEVGNQVATGEFALGPAPTPQCDQTQHETIQSLQNYLPGESVNLSGSGFAPSCEVLMAVNAPDGSQIGDRVTTNSSGGLAYSYSIGSTGDYSVQAVTTDGAISLAATSFSSGSYVTTDDSDYRPGQTVTIMGRGFQPGETIDLLIRQTYPGGLPDRSLACVADGLGAFFNSEFVVGEQDLNTSLSVTATGQSSGTSAQGWFTDAAPAFVNKEVNFTSATAAASISTTYSPVPVAGNLLVAIVGAFGNGTAIGAPSGWSTAINEPGTSTTPAQGIFYKRSVGLADAVVSASLTPSTTATITLLEYSGIPTSGDPFDGANSNTGGSVAAASTGAVTVTSGLGTDLLVGGVSAETAGSALSMALGTVTNGFLVETPTGTVNGGGGGVQKIASQSGRRFNSIAPNSTGWTISGTGVPGSIIGWRGQIAAFKLNQTTTTLTASTPSPVIANATITLTATVVPNVVTGTVTFKDGGVDISGCIGLTTSSGVATCPTPALAAGSHTFTATYNGNPATLDSSTSNSLVYTVSAAATSDCFRSNVTPGTWSTVGHWQEAKPVSSACPTDNSAWVTGTLVPSSAATGIQIRNGHIMTVPSGSFTAQNLTIDAGGDLEIASGGTLALPLNDTVVINGMFGVTGTFSQNGSTIAQVNSGGTLNIKSGGVMNGSGGSGSTLSATNVASGGQFIIDAGGSVAAGGGNGMSITVGAGGTATWNGTVNMGEALTVNGTLTSSQNITLGSAGISNLQVGGTLTMTGGTLTVDRGNGGSNGSINSGGSLVLQGSSVFALNGVNTASVTVASGGTLDIGANAVVSGSATLVTSAGSNVKIASAAGVNGNVTSLRNFNAGTNWTFDGTGAQVTGTNLPATVANLTIATGASVTPSNPGLIVTNTLTVQSGASFTKTGTFQMELGTGGVSNAGTIQMHGTASCGGTDNVLVLKSTSLGAQRAWNGGGTYDIFDVSVQDQGGTASITALSSTSINGNGANWTFVAGCAANFTVTPSSSGNGTIAPSTPQSVASGAQPVFTLTPAAGYHSLSVTGTCGGSLVGDTFTTAAVSADCTVIANFAINTYTLSYTAGANGSLTGNTSQTVNDGASGTAVTAVPAAGYHFVDWSDTSTANPRTDSNVHANISVTANFAINTYTLTYTAGANGSLTGNTSQTVNDGASGTAVTAVPAAGYHFVDWSDTSTANPRTDANVHANISVTANFAINTYTLTYTAGANGSLTGNTSQTVNDGASGTAVTAVPAAGYHFVNWSDTSTANPRTDANVHANISVTANFAINTYTLTYTAGANGSLTGNTSQTVNDGASGTAVTAVPAAGYHFVNWSDTSTANPRTDANVHANISVTANFAINTYTLTYTAGANGSLTGNTSQTVNDGASGTAVTAVPAAGYHFVNWSDTSTANPRTDANVHANISVTANFAINTYTLTYTAGANGSLTGNTSQTVNDGASGTAVTAVPAAGYHFVDWSDTSTANPRTDANVHANISVTANFAINTYTLTYTAGANGSLTGNTSQTVNDGASGTAVTAVPAAGYHFVDWSDTSTANPRTDANVHANISVTANFAINTYTLTYTAGANGSLTGNTSQTVNDGASGTAVTAVPAAGYHFVDWSDTSTANPRTDANVHANISVTANFAINTYTLTYTAGANGSLTGNTSQTVNDGASGTAVTAVPAAGYHFVNWSDTSIANPRTDSNVHANVSVTANFAINTYTIGGTASGLTGSVVLQDNGGDNLTVSANGSFTFATQIAHGGAYAVTVLTQPIGQTCTVSNGSGNATANVTNVGVNCTTNTYTIGGTVSGLSGSVTLQDNGGDNLTVSANGGFTFATSIAHGGAYAVTVLTQPSGQTCTVANSSGTATANVTDVAVTCATITFTVSFNSNGGSVVPSQIVAFGGMATEPDPAPTKSGFTFAGWYSNAGLTNAFAFTTTAIMADTTLYAKWATGDLVAPITSNTVATPNPAQVGSGNVTLTATVSDATTGNANVSGAEYMVTGSAAWNAAHVPAWLPMTALGALNTPTENFTASLSGLTAATGVYTICVRGTDQYGNVAGPGIECVLVASYDPTAGFVTGGGWIMSPATAYTADPSLTGKANFGFVSKYVKGKTLPTGDTEFQFKAGNFNFKSTSYDWLVISGAKAQYQGRGTINGAGDYSFILTAIDGDLLGTKKADTFRLKVFDQNQGNAVIYDNQLNGADTADPTTTIGGGSIVVHK